MNDEKPDRFGLTVTIKKLKSVYTYYAFRCLYNIDCLCMCASNKF